MQNLQGKIVPRRYPRRQNHGYKSKKDYQILGSLGGPRNYQSYFSLPLLPLIFVFIIFPYF